MLLLNLLIVLVPPTALVAAAGNHSGVGLSSRLKAVGLGAVGMGVALLVGFLVVPVALQISGLPGLLFSAFVTAALVEESSKTLILLPVLRNEEDFPRTAGAVRGALVGTGFSVVETLLHVGSAPSVVGVRTITAWPLHLGAGLLIGYTIAAERQGDGVPAVLGLLLAVLFHGFYDLFLLLGNDASLLIIPLLLLLAGCAVLFLCRARKWELRQERRSE